MTSTSVMSVPFFRPSIGEAEIAEVVNCLRSGWLTSGPTAKRFETAFAAAVGGKHAVAVNSCTAALHLAVEALGLTRGQAVLVSSHILDEMDELADRIVFMGRGRVLAVGTLPDIRAMFAGQPQQIRIACRQQRELASRLIPWEHVLRIELAGTDDLLLQVIRPDDFFRRFAELIIETSFDVARLETTDATTEATFQYVMSAAAKF